MPSWDTLSGSYRKRGAKGCSHHFCSFVPNRVVHVWAHKNVQTRDCDHIPPYLSQTWAQPLFEQEGSATRGTRLCPVSAPSSYYRVGKTEELLQRNQALVSRIFFFNWFPPVRLVSGETGCFHREKNPSPSSTRTRPASPWPISSSKVTAEQVYFCQQQWRRLWEEASHSSGS